MTTAKRIFRKIHSTYLKIINRGKAETVLLGPKAVELVTRVILN